MADQDSLRRRLAELETEHRDLDDVIARIRKRLAKRAKNP